MVNVVSFVWRLHCLPHTIVQVLWSMWTLCLDHTSCPGNYCAPRFWTLDCASVTSKNSLYNVKCAVLVRVGVVLTGLLTLIACVRFTIVILCAHIKSPQSNYKHPRGHNRDDPSIAKVSIKLSVLHNAIFLHSYRTSVDATCESCQPLICLDISSTHTYFSDVTLLLPMWCFSFHCVCTLLFT